MKIKTLRDFLGIPKGSIGEVVTMPNNKKFLSSMEVKFECKSESILIGYPTDDLYTVIDE
jgi:hypothetical protein